MSLGSSSILRTINPSTGETLSEYFIESEEDVEKKLLLSSTQWRIWKKEKLSQRQKLLAMLAKVLKRNEEEYAKLMSLEMGKPITQSIAELRKCALLCEYYAENALQQLSPLSISTEAKKSYVSFEPLGNILGVMPWNFPFWQVFRFAVPTLLCGNTAMLKHASNVPGCAQAIEKIFLEAGFPEGVFQNLIIPAERVSSLIADSRVQGVSLTGSEKAGRAVASAAGLNLKKSLLELGGSDPYVVLKDCDLELAAESCVNSRLINSGQSCIAAKRFIVESPIYKEFLSLVVEKMNSKKIGDALSRETKIGPLARDDLRKTVHEQVEKSAQEGADLILGGKILDGPGAFYPCTVLAHVRKGMRVYEEECFGPVASVIKAKDQQEAIDIANDTSYGLGAAVFTKDLEKGERIAREELQAGSCFVNQFVKSDPRLPFGGIRNSGYGRELGLFGIREFANIKTISLA